MIWLTVLVTLFLFAYLFVALLRPEKFQPDRVRPRHTALCRVCGSDTDPHDETPR